MKVLFCLVSLVVILASCSDSEKITPYWKPKKEEIFDMSVNRFIEEISFLFVMDDSGSMSEEKKILADQIKSFLEPLLERYPHYKYNFAITNMKKDFDQVVKPLFFNSKLIREKCSIDPFLVSIKSQWGSYFSYSGQGSLVSWDEMVCAVSHNIQDPNRKTDDEVFFSSLRYISGKTDNTFQSQFFGRNKFLFLFFISDAAGNEYRTRLNNNLSASDEMAKKAYEMLGGLMENAVENVRVYAVIPPVKKPDGQCNLDDTAIKNGEYHSADPVLSLIEKLGGLSLSICDIDWGAQLSQVSDSMLDAVSVHQVLYLEEVPKRGTIEVFFNDKPVEENPDTGWYLDRERLVIRFGEEFDPFDYAQFKSGEESQVTIRYKPMNIDVLRKSQ